jgi:hypothetical protein
VSQNINTPVPGTFKEFCAAYEKLDAELAGEKRPGDESLKRE